MELIKFQLTLIALALCVSCGLALPDESRRESPRSQGLGESPLNGSFRSLDGSTIQLEQESGSIQVLMFVSETCSVCRAETTRLVAQFEAKGGLPTNARLYSLAVGSFPEDAADWRNGLGVTWTVGTEEGDSLFRRYCPELQTPCTLLRNPTSGALTKLIGEHSQAEWEEATGEWTYQINRKEK